jgi:alkylhydroperoxidase family enzyme
MALLPMIAQADFPPALAQAVEQGVATRMLSSILPIRVWAHRPEAAVAWLGLLDQLHNHGVLDARLRELVRLRIAAYTTCRVCQVARKSDAVSDADVACLSADDARFTPAEQAALRYAELFAADPLAIDEATFDALKAHFDTPQIVELNMFCALMLAGGRMTQAQRAYEETPP